MTNIVTPYEFEHLVSSLEPLEVRYLSLRLELEMIKILLLRSRKLAVKNGYVKPESLKD